MSNVELFVLGVVVTVMTAAALAPLIWAAIQDGRYNEQQQQLYLQQAVRAAATTAPVEAEGVSHAS